MLATGADNHVAINALLSFAFCKRNKSMEKRARADARVRRAVSFSTGGIHGSLNRSILIKWLGAIAPYEIAIPVSCSPDNHTLTIFFAVNGAYQFLDRPSHVITSHFRYISVIMYLSCSDSILA